jgi:hypothetical protein
MFGPTLTTMRRLPVALRLKLQTIYAESWEALTDTHQAQAMMFVRRMADRLSLEDALARYFHEVAVPVAMRETVRARALLSLAERINPDPTPARGMDRWDRLRPDRLLLAVRRRAQYVEETTLQCRMAACVAEAAVMATHVRMATQVGELLGEVMLADEAVMVYVRSFELPVKEGDAVFRGALAQLARQRLPAMESPRLQVATVAPRVPEAAPERAAPAVAALNAGPAFGLRVIV